MTTEKSCWDQMGYTSFILLATSYALLLVPQISCQVNGPMTCKEPGSSCPAYMYYPLAEGDQIENIHDLFTVQDEDIKELNTNVPTGAVLVEVNCTCSGGQYLAGTAYRVTSVDTNEKEIAQKIYKYLAYETGQSTSFGKMLSINLFCGCTDTASKHLVSYVWQVRDTIEGLAKSFNVDEGTLQALNNLTDSSFFANTVVFYIPISESDVKPAIINTPSQLPATGSTRDGNIPLGAIVGIVLAGLLLVAAVAALVFFLQKRRMCCYAPRYKPPFRDTSSLASRDMHQDRNSFFSCFKRPNIIHFRNPNTNVKRRISLSKEMMNGVFGMEKPIIFPYHEIIVATDDFKEKNHLGAGAYGSVYQGKLRGQDVAIKRMKATKRKEFFAELKVLCKVHHTNLVELIGYSVSEEELFLVYEFAENRAVSDRLHDPLSKEYTPLSWNARVQIALDAARGLEYIHEHTKAHYVHRDVKTSNILLDGCFRAKVADFGLAKLVEATDGETATTGVVGTSGYLAPEYLRDGQATAKSDVYAFGVVLFELITGEEAFFKSRANPHATPDKRSLISIMLSALGDGSPYYTTKFKSCIDPLLQEMFPLDCVHRMATLGRQCVEEDPAVRPDMKQVVFTLSQLLLASIEWEATLAGNSQVFSGLVIGR